MKITPRRVSAGRFWALASVGVAAIAAAVGSAALGGRWRKLRVPGRALSAERQLAELTARASRLGQAAQRLDHDLRAPVGAMAVALELMRSTDDPALREEAVQVLGRQVARMTTLTQQVHEFSRELNG